MKHLKKSLLSVSLVASAIASGNAHSNNVTPELYFVNPAAAVQKVSYEQRAQGTDRSRINDLHIYDNKLFSVYGSWDNDNEGYVHICAQDLATNKLDCSYRFGAHGIYTIHEVNDKLYFMAADSAESNPVFPYQGLAIYDKNTGWQSVSANNFKDVDGSYIWYAHAGNIKGVGNTLYATFSSGNGYTTRNKIFKSNDGGINWRAEPLTHFNNMVSHQGSLYSIDRYGAVFDDDKYLYGPWFDERLRANNVIYKEDGNGWVKYENAPLIFPDYNEYYDLQGGHWTQGNPISFKDKVVLTLRKRRFVTTSSGARRWFTEQALSVTDLQNDANQEDIIYRTGLFRYCDGVPLHLHYTCRDLPIKDLHATDNWLYMLLKTGEIRRTSDLKNWEVISEDDDFADDIMTVSIEADDQFVYVGADKGRVYKVKLPQTQMNVDIKTIDLSPLPALSSTFYSWAGSVSGTLSDTFEYDPSNPTAVLPQQEFNYSSGNGAFGFMPEGEDVTLAYSTNYVHMGGKFVIDLYGRNDYGQERDDNISVFLISDSGQELGRVINLKIDDDGHARASFESLAQSSIVSQIVVKMHDTAFTFGNFAALMEIRAAGNNLL